MPTNKKKVLIIDGNNVAYAAYSVFKRTQGGLLTSSTGIPTTVFFGMLNVLSTFTEKNAVDRVIICWDVKGGSAWRKSVFKHYKANRSGNYKDMDDYFAELDSAKEYLSAIGIPQAPCEGVEADDVIGWLAKRYVRKGWQSVVFSNDKDYYQLLDEDTTLWRPCTQKMYTHSMVPEEKACMGLGPQHLHKLQGLTGQAKDNIPGACELDSDNVMIKWGFGEAYACKLLKHPDNPDHKLSVCKKLLLADKSPLSEPKTTQLLKNWKRVLLSARLSKIRTRMKEYELWEVALLNSVYKQSLSKTVYTVSELNYVASMLDISKLSVPRICRSIGVNIRGKVQKNPTRKRIKL